MAAWPANGSSMKGVGDGPGTSLPSVMVVASSLTLPEIMVVLEDTFKSSDLTEDWARASAGNRITVAIVKRNILLMGRLSEL